MKDKNCYVRLTNCSNTNDLLVGRYCGKEEINLEYSFDKKYWKDFNYESNGKFQYSVEVPAYSTIYLRGENIDTEFDLDNHFNFKLISNEFNIGGDVRTLLNWKNVDSVTKIPNHCFYRCFKGSKIIECLWSMGGIVEVGMSGFYESFRDCNRLIQPPLFEDVIIVANYAFQSCFENCVELWSTPYFCNLENVGIASFERCFKNCTKIIHSCDFINIMNIKRRSFFCCFENCVDLRTVCHVFFNKLNVIAKSGFGYCFKNCISLCEVPEFSNVNEIESNGLRSCFENCSSLVIPPKFSKLKIIRTYGMFACFSGCLRLITLPSFPIIDFGGDGAFIECFRCCLSIKEKDTILIREEANDRTFERMFAED